MGRITPAVAGTATAEAGVSPSEQYVSILSFSGRVRKRTLRVRCVSWELEAPTTSILPVEDASERADLSDYA